MDPETLRLMTDPEARKDPAKMRAMTDRLLAESRRTVIDSARTNSIVMGVLGTLLVVVGLGIGAAFLFTSLVPGIPEIPVQALFASLLCIVIGGPFVFFARWTAMPSKSLMRSGVRARATVREVKAFGRSIGVSNPGVSATLSRVTVVLAVEPECLPRFDTEHSEFITGGDLKHLQVGATVAVRCDPRNPARLVFDWDAI